MAKLVTKEMRVLAETIVKSCKYTLESFERKENIPFYIGSVRICGSGKDVVLRYDDSVVGSYMKEWRRDAGGILLGCVKKEEYEKLYELSNGDFRFLLYRMDDDTDMEKYEGSPLKFLSVADARYIIVRMVPAGVPYSAKDKFVKEDDVRVVSEEYIVEDNEEEELISEDPLFN